MDLKKFIMSRFGKDVFSIKEDDLLRERVRIEKEVERISDDLKGIAEKIQKLMLEAKGQPTTLKMLNVQKIKALRLESRTKQMEASHFLRELQLIMLVEAMKEREKTEKESALTKEILSSDMDKLNEVLTDEDVKEALEEGRLDKVKEKLERVFGKEEVLVDNESQELISAIDDLERVDEETALKMAGEKAKKITEESAEKEME
ncbi:MAG: hypothetical protein JSV39_04630 [Candidatus Aenigmatarchaeota archaeon]|nr:MAG: hypothetical protein JSV39_04630 [Candidatus Aenigmarchaeota archaeon]